MNSWKNNNLLPTDKETFIDAKMNNLMNFLNAEDLSSNKELVSEVHFDESVNLKEATKYNPKAYNFAASSFHMTLDGLEDMVNNNIDQLNTLAAQDKGIQKRYPDLIYSKEQWLDRIKYLRENIEFYKPEKFGTQYVKGYRSITLNKYLDFNQEQPGICWAWNKIYQKQNEADFILDGTGNGSRYLLRLKAAFKNSDIDWVKTVYLLQNDEGELRLHPNGKAYILDKLIYNLKDKNRGKELDVASVADREGSLAGNRRYLTTLYNPETGRYDIDDASDIDLNIIYRNGKFLVPIGLWNGDLKVSNLESFKNGPTKVTGNFDCSGSTSITSLEGAPEYVGEDFSCRNCKNLTSLEGAPKHVGGNFTCGKCRKLTSLEGIPEYIGGDFSCYSCTGLTSLRGAPEKVVGTFTCDKCSKLTSLEGAPREVGRDFHCWKCTGITSLKGSPEKVGWGFDCCECNKLRNLEGCPKEARQIACNSCKSLTSFKGAPEEIHDIFECCDCEKITSLEGLPKKIGEILLICNCGKPFTEEEIRAVCDVKKIMLEL